jgi:phage terminase large subunit
MKNSKRSPVASNPATSLTSLQLRAKAEQERRRRSLVRNLDQIAAVPDWAKPLLAKSRYKGAYGGRSGGKSHFFGEQIVKRFIENPDLRIVCIREIQKSLKYSAKSLIEDKIRSFGVKHLVREMVGEVRSTQGDGFIIFQGMQDHTADSVKGLEGIDIVWAEEAQNLSQRSIDLLLPTIRKPGSEIWFSWNPDQPENPVDRFFRGESGLPDGAILVNVNYTDNPFISEEAIALANTARKQDMQAYLHIWMGHYNVKSDAQILNGKWFVDEFSPYEPTVNGDVQVKAGWDGPYFGADFGFAQDPTVLIKLWIHDRCLYVERESYAVGLELDHTADRWKLDIPDCHLYTVRADNARPESISYLKRHGIPKIVAVSKGAGSVEDGIAHLRSYDKIIIILAARTRSRKRDSIPTRSID